ncbi:MAG: PKD domain-containing protein [Thermoplasmatota archaeon]
MAPSPTPTTHTPTASPPRQNHLHASVSASSLGGPAPMNVTFTLRATDDGTATFNWTFDAVGSGHPEVNGTSVDLPATARHQYDAAGNYTALFRVWDSTNATTSRVPIGVQAVPHGTTQEISGSYTVGVCSGSRNVTGEDVYEIDADLLKASVGRPFIATWNGFTAPAAYLTIGFTNDMAAPTGGSQSGAGASVSSLRGTVPAGSTAVQLSSCGGAGSVSVTMIVS